MTVDPIATTEAALSRETFDFAEAVLDRAYPEIEVPIYLDERKAQRLVQVAVELAEADLAVSNAKGNPSSEAIERVAQTTGFRDPERMRRAFIRAFGQPPQSLRRAARAG